MNLAVDEFGILTAPSRRFRSTPVSTTGTSHIQKSQLQSLSNGNPKHESVAERVLVPLVRDLVLDEPAFALISDIASSDVRIVGNGQLGERPLIVVQVVGRVEDAIDKSASLVEDFGSYQIMRLPSFYEDVERRLTSRIFRVPEMYPEVFVGETIKRKIMSSGLGSCRTKLRKD